ncbi:diguanylate cyclase [Sphingomonas sp. So64.6b]|uniref:GGDEF domain-containing protein n=1 Tax=Sphingomonas sp. So64.6b TaxID=2997354 RepID=UPI001603B4FD|nr:diguanylate cyclase [Sphingomonas sp. So64.6b]QNA84989.1 diguanylate cyclase [Sphingomonas sp. So64.6b]
MLRALFFNLLALTCFSFATLFAMSAPAHAQAGTVGKPIHLCILRAAPDMTAATLFRSPAAFDCTTPQPSFGSGNFWAISQPMSVSDPRQRIGVRVLSQWQDSMTLYALYADGKVATIRTDAHSATRHLQLGAIVHRWLPRRDVPVVRLLWHVEGSMNLRGIVLGATIATGTEAAMSNIVLAAIYSGFGGLCLALLLYNLGLARALRQDYLPLYCMMLVALMLYAFSSSGALAWAFNDIDNRARLRVNYVTLAMVGVSAVAFLGYFFEHGVMTPRLRALSRIASVAVALPALGVALLAPWGMRVFDTAFALGFGLLILSILPILYSAWRHRSPYLWLFVVAWSAPIGLAALRTAYSFNLLEYSFWIDNSTVASMAIEAVLSSMAIAYRILMISRERDEARQQETAARLLADTDPLTGLLNRRAFLNRAIGRDGDQALLLIDIDNFKRVNDTIGHDGGDEVLRVVARILRATTHPQALVARIGGEEFAVVTPRDRQIEPESILAGFRSGRMPFDLLVTASIGVCVGPLTKEADWKALYRAADRALFDAKEAGRDRVRAAGSPQLKRAAAA